MLSQSKNRVQAIKNKFENLGTETESLIVRKKSVNLSENHLFKHSLACHTTSIENYSNDKENSILDPSVSISNQPEAHEIHSSNEELPLEPNSSYLYNKSDVKRSLGEAKKSLTRQCSDPGKKLHRSHAFRCDRSQKIPKESPKRHGSCNGRSETSDFALKMGDKRLSKDRLKRLGNLLEDQMRKENFKPVEKLVDENAADAMIPLALEANCVSNSTEESVLLNSIPDEAVPQHILDQYAKVLKPKKKENVDTKQDAMTDSGVSSETENQDDDRSRIKKLRTQFEGETVLQQPLKTNLVNLEDELCGSSETMKLEKKNPHLTLTDTLKKALKQPLPAGPPPKKPPRSLNTVGTIQESPEIKRKDTREMLRKLEQVLQKREAQKAKNVYDIAETNLSLTQPKPKEMHYLCTEILDITQRTLLPNQTNTTAVLKNCFNSLNCAIVNNQSMTSLPYARLSTGSISNRSSVNICCSCSMDSLDMDRPRLSTFKDDTSFKCHLNSTCKEHGSKFFVQKNEDKEHIYDVPFGDKTDVVSASGNGGSVVKTLLSKSLTSDYGVVNATLSRLQSRSMEELSLPKTYEEPKIYDIPCDDSRSATPESDRSGSSESEMPTPSPEEPRSDERPRAGDASPKVYLERAKRQKSDLERPKSGLEGSSAGLEVRRSHRGRITNFEQRKLSFEALKTDARSRPSAAIGGEDAFENRKTPFEGRKFDSCRGRFVDLERRNLAADDVKMDGRKSSFEGLNTDVPRAKSALTQSVSEDKKAIVSEYTTQSNFDRLRLNFENSNLTVAKVKDVRTPKASVENAKKSPLKDNEVTDQKSPMKLVESPQKTTQKPPVSADKPQPLKSRPPMVKMPSDSKLKARDLNSSDEFKSTRKGLEKKFATEARRYKKSDNVAGSGLALTLARRERNHQLDVDKENLNRLMNEIYDTVTAACKMDEAKPSRFPTDSDAASEESTKLTRSLTEKRKNYVRRVSSKAAYLDPKLARRYRHQTSVCSYTPDTAYSTFRSWRSFRHSRRSIDSMAADVSKMADKFKMADRNDSTCNLTDSSGNLLSMKDEFDGDDLSLDKKAGCLDFDLPFGPRERGLFDICLLVGLNYMTGEAYVKSVFPSQVKVPAHIENLVFPETLSLEGESKLECELSASKTQCYSLVLTDEKGERNYGYCRRVLPEGATACLPLCYCLIARYRAPGFYYKVLREIESHHGSSEVEINTVLQQLIEADFPNPGEVITLNYEVNTGRDLCKNAFRNSVNLGDVLKCKTLPDKRRNESDQTADGQHSDRVPDFYDLENNNRTTKVTFLHVQSVKTKVIKRPIDPRVDEGSLSVLLDTLGAGLLIKVFGSLLLERKVVLMGDDLSQLSSCIEALQCILYPLVWQQPLISALPAELRTEILEAPLPLLAGSLRARTTQTYDFDEGMLIDISTQPARVLCFQGDESTILPAASYKTLKTTLQMESYRNLQRVDRKDEKTRNVMISEAFLRFFVDILADFWAHFTIGAVNGGLGKGDVVFQKEAFIKSASSKQNNEFLEWFTETAMFNHFVQNMAAAYHERQKMAPQPVDYSTIEGIVDAPLPNYYEMFDGRLARSGKKQTTKTPKEKEIEGKSNYKSAVNKKVNKLKMKLKDFW